MSTTSMRASAASLLIAASIAFAATASADAAKIAKIDAKVAATIKEFGANTPPKVQHYVATAKGALVFPDVFKAGIGIGGEYGEGALIIGNKIVEHYSVAGASIGLQFGAQSRAQIILFMTPTALASFRASKGWKAGVDGSIALVKIGAGGEVLTPDADKQAVLGFVYGAKGLMYNLNFEGQKFSKLKG
jgi:lipid-binding SYLF domain-containing protein